MKSLNLIVLSVLGLSSCASFRSPEAAPADDSLVKAIRGKKIAITGIQADKGVDQALERALANLVAGEHAFEILRREELRQAADNDVEAVLEESARKVGARFTLRMKVLRYEYDRKVERKLETFATNGPSSETSDKDSEPVDLVVTTIKGKVAIELRFKDLQDGRTYDQVASHEATMGNRHLASLDIKDGMPARELFLEGISYGAFRKYMVIGSKPGAAAQSQVKASPPNE